MVIVVTEDIINCFISTLEDSIEFDVLSVNDRFECVPIHSEYLSFLVPFNVMPGTRGIPD